MRTVDKQWIWRVEIKWDSRIGGDVAEVKPCKPKYWDKIRYDRIRFHVKNY
jgi:hypothetical protein